MTGVQTCALPILLLQRRSQNKNPQHFFFLSKYGTEVDEIIFYNKKNIKKMWSRYDVIVTANPELLLCKPKNKISIKVSTPYNTEITADYTINNIEGFTSVYNQL